MRFTFIGLITCNTKNTAELCFEQTKYLDYTETSFVIYVSGLPNIISRNFFKFNQYNAFKVMLFFLVS